MDHIFMKRALELATQGIGYTNPNPMVGAVIVKENKIIAEGFHQNYGGPHAEINAFQNAKANVTEATMYVTLEPCSHHGKTPPCAYAIVEKGIKKVVIAMEDPNPIVSGKGIHILTENGIEVVLGVMKHEAQKLNEIFIKYITTKQPFCILKTAMTLDGKIATYEGDSKWISSQDSRTYVHKLRHQVSAIMVGIGTIIADDPMLTARLDKHPARNPIRIVVDTSAKIPLEANVLKIDDFTKTILVTTELASKDKIKQLESLGINVLLTPLKNNQVDLKYLMTSLGERKIDSVLLEGGSTLNYSALDEGIVDKVISFIAPKIIGGAQAKTPVGGLGIPLMKDALILSDVSMSRFGDDLMVEGYLREEV